MALLVEHMGLSLKESVELARVPKSTLWRYIKNGKISATKNAKGEYEIDPAELQRVFHKTMAHPNSTDETAMERRSVSPRNELQIQIEGLRQLVEAHERTIDSKSEDIKDLRRRLDLSEEKLGVSESERRVLTEKVTALLTHDIEHKKASSRTGIYITLAVITILMTLSLVAIKFNLITFN